MTDDERAKIRPSRRGFLTAGVATAAGAAAGAVGAFAIGQQSGGDGNPHASAFTPVPERDEPGFDHLVVLMFENRSFDHMLGRLHPVSDTFAGVTDEHVNTAPDGTPIPAHVYTGSTDRIMAQPDPDPGEYYSHVNTQLFDVVDPPSNADLAAHGVAAPWNLPTGDREPSMTGFVRDYAIAFRAERGQDATNDELAAVMGGFSPEMLPVLSAIARGFAVYDHWFSAAPTQTFANRSFFHASTSHGFVTNGMHGGQEKWLNARAVPTIFNRLQDAGLSWRVYYDEEQVVSLTGMLHAPSIEPYWQTNFRSMEQFHEDARTGNLPAYAFIEPRMVFDHNDMHPPIGRGTHEAAIDAAASDMRAGEALLHEVYTAIRTAASPTGSNAMNTALLITFDEHGGIYDHVPPPAAVPPEPGAGEMDFTFDRLGCRVPSILVSAYVGEGTVVNHRMHHGALIRTLVERHGLAPLTERDASARGLRGDLTLTTPRQSALWPTTHAPYVPPNPEARTYDPDGGHRHRLLTPPATSLIGLLLARYEPGVPVPTEFGDAYEILHRHGEGLFGTRD